MTPSDATNITNYSVEAVRQFAAVAVLPPLASDCTSATAVVLPSVRDSLNKLINYSILLAKLIVLKLRFSGVEFK